MLKLAGKKYFNKLPNMFDQAKQLYKLQKDAKKVKKQLQNTHIEAEHEGITIIINGEQEVVEVKITEEAMQDHGKLQKNFVICLNKAIKKSQQVGAELMKDIMGDFNLPGLTGGNK